MLAELHYVSWPNKDDIKEGTMVVIVMSSIVSVFLFLVDSVFGMILKYLVSGFKG